MRKILNVEDTPPCNVFQVQICRYVGGGGGVRDAFLDNVM